MESTQQSDRETYRAIVLGQGGNELLLKPAGEGFLLPSVEIPRWQRLAENMTAAMRKEWGHEVGCLFSPDAAVPAWSPNGRNYQVMESCEHVARSSPRAQWVHVSSLSERTFVDPADQVAVQRSLAECDRYAGAAALGPFARLGWFRELQEWIKEVIGPLGFHLTGSFSQLDASPSFSLVRFETSGPAVWFKAVGNPNLREFPITLALGKLLPQYLPPILAARPEWNGWLALEVEGTNLGETQDAQHWRAAASALAKLQIESIGRFGTLVDSGGRGRCMAPEGCAGILPIPRSSREHDAVAHLQTPRVPAMAECSGPPQPARTDALGTFYPSLEPVDSSSPAFCTPIPMHASTPLILRKSRMRRRARTDLCGGRSAMVVPTATVSHSRRVRLGPRWKIMNRK